MLVFSSYLFTAVGGFSFMFTTLKDKITAFILELNTSIETTISLLQDYNKRIENLEKHNEDMKNIISYSVSNGLYSLTVQ